MCQGRAVRRIRPKALTVRPTMRHETGHAVAHHGAERMSEEIAVQTLGQVGGAMLSPQYQSLAMAAYSVRIS